MKWFLATWQSWAITGGPVREDVNRVLVVPLSQNEQPLMDSTLDCWTLASCLSDWVGVKRAEVNWLGGTIAYNWAQLAPIVFAKSSMFLCSFPLTKPHPSLTGPKGTWLGFLFLLMSNIKRTRTVVIHPVLLLKLYRHVTMCFRLDNRVETCMDAELLSSWTFFKPRYSDLD